MFPFVLYFFWGLLFLWVFKAFIVNGIWAWIFACHSIYITSKLLWIFQSCSRILLDETLRKDFLKKMRSSKMEPLKKGELMKKIVKKCNSKAVKCSKCGYINGLSSVFAFDASIISTTVKNNRLLNYI